MTRTAIAMPDEPDKPDNGDAGRNVELLRELLSHGHGLVVSHHAAGSYAKATIICNGTNFATQRPIGMSWTSRGSPMSETPSVP